MAKQNSKKGFRAPWVGGSQKEPESPGKRADKNRLKGDSISAKLRTINFRKLEKSGVVEPEELEDMRMSVEACAAMLENSDTLFEDFKELDGMIADAADALKTAVEKHSDAYVDQAQWCIRGISAALVYLRDNIPEHVADRRSQIIKERVAYMEKYRNLIILYGKIAENRVRSQALARDIEGLDAQYAPLRDEIMRMGDSIETMIPLAQLNSAVANPNLTPEQQELVAKLTRTGNLASSLTLLKNERYTLSLAEETLLMETMGFRTALSARPSIYNVDLMGEYGAVLQEINAGINRMLTETAQVIELQQSYENQLNAIMQGSAARLITERATRVAKKILEKKDENVSRHAILEAEREKAKLIRIENERQLEKERAEAALAEKIIENNKNVNTAEAVNRNKVTAENKNPVFLVNS